MTFCKYHGTGNDFVIIDNRNGLFTSDDSALVKNLCDRRFGVGADGLILLEADVEADVEADFKMVYYNSDGNLSSMCGNGGRCIVHFANKLGVIQEETSFLAVDGMHSASINGDMVNLEMSDVADIELHNDEAFMDTGSPHYLVWEDDLDRLDIMSKAQRIRYNDRFKDEGTNVDFLSWDGEVLNMRTYERGVEGETHSCGTGMVAAALFASLSDKLGEQETCKINTKGGSAEVQFRKSGDHAFDQIHLIGPATFVYEGTINV